MTEETKTSSEEVKDEDLAQEALDATASAEEETSPAEESGTKDEPTVPLHKHTELRTRAQQAEVAQARAEGALAAIKQQRSTDTPPPKSPLQMEIERQSEQGILEEDMTVSPSIIKQQDIFNRQVANQEAATAKSQALLVKQQASANRAKGEIEDWQQIILAGDGFLTKGEAIDIAACGDNFGQVAYDKCKIAIARNAPKTESKTHTAPEKKQSESEAEKVPSQQEILKSVEGDPVAVAAAQL